MTAIIVVLIALGVAVIALIIWSLVTMEHINALYREDQLLAYQLNDVSRDVSNLKSNLRSVIGQLEAIDKVELDKDTAEAIDDLMKTVKELAK